MPDVTQDRPSVPQSPVPIRPYNPSVDPVAFEPRLDVEDGVIVYPRRAGTARFAVRRERLLSEPPGSRAVVTSGAPPQNPSEYECRLGPLMGWDVVTLATEPGLFSEGKGWRPAASFGEYVGQVAPRHRNLGVIGA